MFLCSFSHHKLPQSCLPLSHGRCRWSRAAVSAGGRISPFRRSLMSSQNLGRGSASRGFGCILFAQAGESSMKPRDGVRIAGGGDGGRRETGRWSDRGQRVHQRPRPRRAGRSPSRSPISHSGGLGVVQGEDGRSGGFGGPTRVCGRRRVGVGRAGAKIASSRHGTMTEARRSDDGLMLLLFTAEG